jgi:CheY-like chemotaxis protein
MDHMMPEMDGIQTTQALRSIKSCENVPIVALTANAVVGMQEIFLKNGMDDFLPKPIDRSKLYAILRKWLPEEKQQTSPVQSGQEGQEGQEKQEGKAPDVTGWMSASVEGVDLPRCLSNYGKEASLDIIRTYVSHSRSVMDKLTALSESNLDEYAIHVHGLKGSSYGICADSIAKMAESLELAAKKRDIDAVKSGNDAFLTALESLLKDLQAFADSISAPDKADMADITDKKRKYEPDRTLLEKLLQNCQRYDMAGMEEALAELERYEYETRQDLPGWLREQLNNLEYQEIIDRLGKELA